MTLTVEQLKLRQRGVGASEVGAILGLDRYRTPFDIWFAKTHPSDQPQMQTAAMTRGHRLEPVVADIYAETHPGVQLVMGETMAHPDAGWALATPDRLVVTPSDAVGLLEIKTKRYRTAQEWGESGTQDVPLLVVAQCQWQMFVVNRPWCDVGLLIDGEEYREYHLERDDDSIAMMHEEVERFWTFHVQGNVAPELKGERVGAYLAQRFRQQSGEIVPAGETADRLMMRLAGIKSEVALLEQEEEHLTNLLKQEVATAKGVAGVAGRFVWSETKGGIDYKGLADSLGPTPEQIEQFRRPSYRAARFTPAKGA